MRRIVQLSQVAAADGGYHLFALCNDGMVFFLVGTSSGSGYCWEALPNIPQNPQMPVPPAAVQ